MTEMHSLCIIKQILKLSCLGQCFIASQCGHAVLEASSGWRKHCSLLISAQEFLLSSSCPKYYRTSWLVAHLPSAQALFGINCFASFLTWHFLSLPSPQLAASTAMHDSFIHNPPSAFLLPFCLCPWTVWLMNIVLSNIPTFLYHLYHFPSVF